MELSIAVPLFNEEQSVPLLHQRIVEAVEPMGVEFELLFVDDGSSDTTFAVAEQLALRDPRLRVIKFRRNCGQTPAMAAGIDHARGRIIVTMDGDLQNDPRDIPMLVAKLEEDYDLVAGWRMKRQDKLVTRKIPSRIANWLIGKITGIPIRDNGCSLKAYRASVMRHVPLYSEMHRFIPIYAAWAGARVTEIPVEHHARTMGKSKYGLSRTLKVVFDLMTIKFMASYQTKPIYVFGSFGMLAFAISILSGLYAVFLKIFHKADFVQTPLPILSIVMFAVGVQFLLMGLLAEMLVRTYHESQAKRIYSVRERLGFNDSKQK